MVSKLSGPSKSLVGGLFTDPQKIENIIGMVRTVAPLTSTQTVTKINTYLPMFEKTSTLLGMYSFLNRAQTFRPIQPLNANSPVEAVTALMKNGNVSKMLAQPLLANNMDKIVGSMAMNMLKNGNFNDILSSVSNSAGNSENGSSLDINSLMETFMPLLSSMSSNSSNDDNNENKEGIKESKFRNESVLPDDDAEEAKEDNGIIYDEKSTPKNEYDRYYRNDRYESHEKAVNYDENKNTYTEKKEIHKPIRIKQRRRR
ncbi:hypothetical protein HZF24_18510 [Sedimentibacter hydroxybenzoicus DSM 7310]|uniref:Uncharacterized protein n=2 Tax=Sedimentibacter hydroxybenzoicus TaxID=29345 RepID=A0A974BMW5_SEDHY|nr:hypothetical protein [Sedimentibacter hydroxybenzoicus DSM 7310]